MQFDTKNPPRSFQAGLQNKITVSDCGSVSLSANEQITLLTEDGAEYDVARKDWGFYATPSINGRLQSFKFKTAFVRNSLDKFYVMLVQQDKINLFEKYLAEDQLTLICWLDEESNLRKIAATFE